MKNNMPVKRNKKYVKKEFRVPRGEIRPPRSLGRKILRIFFIVLVTALMLLTITIKVRHYFTKHW